MRNKKLILQRKNEEQLFNFSKGLNVVEDLKLSKELETENIKNEDSNLLIKSLNDTPIFDVIQIKINLTKTGVFLVNFEKEKFQDDTRKEMLEELSALKVKEELTIKTQTKKAQKILEIVNKYKPIYVTFQNSSEIKINIEKISEKITWNCPLLSLPLQPKFSLFKSKGSKKNKNNKFFDVSYLFVTLLSLSFAFGVSSGIHTLITKQKLYPFLFAAAGVFLIANTYIFFDILKLNKKQKNMHYILAVYSFIGMILGGTVGIVVDKFALCKDDVTLNLKMVLLVTAASIIVGVILSTLIAKLILKIYMKKRKN